jgi:hypothetical protein
MEGQIAITTLLRRASDLHLAVPPEALRWRRALVLRGLESLPVVWAKPWMMPQSETQQAVLSSKEAP